MFALIKIEWLKIKKYRAFWWMLGIVALTYPGINGLFYYAYESAASQKEAAGAAVKLLLGNPFAFPETWHTVAYLSSFFVLLPSILVIMMTTNEYTYRTHRQNIIDGWSRNQFISSKLCDVFIVSGIVTIVYALVALLFGLTADDTRIYQWGYQLEYIPLFFLQSFAQLSIAFLLAYLVKKAFIALGIFLFYYLIIENIAVNYLKYELKTEVGRFFPFEISDKLIPNPSFSRSWGADAKAAYDHSIALIPEHVVYSIVLTAGIWLLCYSIHKKRDL